MKFCVPEVKEIKISGFVTKPALEGEQTELIQTGIFTSFEEDFHNYANNINSLISSTLGKEAPLQFSNLLVVIDKNDQARIYIDNFPICIRSMGKRDIQKNEKVSLNDLLGVESVAFSLEDNECKINDGEKVICILRNGFAFLFYFNFLENITEKEHSKNIAIAFNQLLYRNLMTQIAHDTYELMFSEGWFPFITIIPKIFSDIFSIYFHNKEGTLEKWMNSFFSTETLKKITEKWWESKSFTKKKDVIEAGMKCYYEGNYISCISTLTPMIEGILDQHHQNTKDQTLSHQGEIIRAYAQEIGERKFGDINSMGMPKEFSLYLKDFFFNPSDKDQSQTARHTVSHGRTRELENFNQIRCIQLILTLEQIYFYLDDKEASKCS